MPSSSEKPALDRHSGLAATLLDLGRCRDPKAWAQLLNQCGQDISRTASQLGGSQLADDIIQETFLQIRDCACRFRPTEFEADISAWRWIRRVTITTASHLQRTRSRQVRRDRRFGVNVSAQTPLAEPHQHVERNETAEAVRFAVAELKETQREVIVLRFFDGLGFESIAADLGIPVGTAKTHANRGIEVLRQRLQRTGLALSSAAVIGALEQISSAESAVNYSLGSATALLTTPLKSSISSLSYFGGMTMASKAALGLTATLVLASAACVISNTTGSRTEANPASRFHGKWSWLNHVKTAGLQIESGEIFALSENQVGLLTAELPLETTNPIQWISLRHVLFQLADGAKVRLTYDRLAASVSTSKDEVFYCKMTPALYAQMERLEADVTAQDKGKTPSK
jgi:RNA polymerase sigma-70 factor, ECF subfamily